MSARPMSMGHARALAMDGPVTTGHVRSEPLLPRNLARAVRYMRDNLREPLTLALLVRASGLTERTLH